MGSIIIREAQEADFPGIWPIFQEAIATGEAFVYPLTMSQEEGKKTWFSPLHRVFIATDSDTIVGTYRLRPNQPGLGSHIANAGYIVDPAYRKRGIASSMCEHSMETARAAGFRAMQFNFVVSTNERAVRLWQRHGFEIVGRVPQAFHRSAHGEFVDVFVMHRFL
jgi:L-amino acid N-acyltransferase YncA